MWSCRDTTERLTDWFEGELTRADRVELGAHLAACRGCRTYLGQLVVTVEALRALPEPALPALPDAVPRELHGRHS
jgi:anti-sigma factor RsiW